MQTAVPGVGSSGVTLDSIKRAQAIGLVYDTIRLATLARDDQGYQDQVGGIMPGAFHVQQMMVISSPLSDFLALWSSHCQVIIRPMIPPILITIFCCFLWHAGVHVRAGH